MTWFDSGAEGCFSVGASGYDSSTLDWVVAVIANGGTVSIAQQGYVNTLIKGLKADGVWAKLDRLWLHASENQPQALTDIVAGSLATAVNSPAFAANRGFTGVAESSTVLIDTNFNPSSAFGSKYTLNSCHLSVWGVTNVQDVAGGGAAIGSLSASSESYIYPWFQDGFTYYALNDGTHDAAGTNTIGTSLGHFLVSRTASNSKAGYWNGTVQYGPVATPVTGLLSNQDLAVLLQNGIASTGSAVQYGISSIGTGLSSTDVTNFYTRLRTYMTSVGVP